MIFQYNLREKKNKDGYVYTEICREMYGLPVAVILAQKLIEKRLNKEGNKHSKVTPGVWTHEWLPVRFTLCVDDFFVKYVGKKYADHVIVVLSKRYKISSDWAGKCYLGLGLDWNDESGRYTSPYLPTSSAPLSVSITKTHKNHRTNPTSTSNQTTELRLNIRNKTIHQHS